jgi:hypothetical protein
MNMLDYGEQVQVVLLGFRPLRPMPAVFNLQFMQVEPAR